MTARVFKAGAALALMLAIAGCAGAGRAYEGDAKASDTVAAIKGTHSLTENDFLIDSVDGKVFSPSVKEVEVLPGMRTVTFHYWDTVHCIPLFQCLGPTSYAYRAVAQIEAEAGHTYRFSGEGSWSDRPDPIRLRVIDETANKVVWQTEVDSNSPSFILKSY